MKLLWNGRINKKEGQNALNVERGCEVNEWTKMKGSGT